MLSKRPEDRFPSIAEAMQAADVAELPEYHPERRRFGQVARTIAARANANVIDIVSIPPTLEVGDTIPLRASARTPSGEAVSAEQINWSTDRNDVATLDAVRGELKAVAAGSLTLFVRSGGAEHQIRVDVRPPQAASIEMAGPKTIRVGEHTSVTAAVRSRNGFRCPDPSSGCQKTRHSSRFRRTES